jgi:hypothetical protein
METSNERLSGGTGAGKSAHARGRGPVGGRLRRVCMGYAQNTCHYFNFSNFISISAYNT